MYNPEYQPITHLRAVDLLWILPLLVGACLIKLVPSAVRVRAS